MFSSKKKLTRIHFKKEILNHSYHEPFTILASNGAHFGTLHHWNRTHRC